MNLPPVTAPTAQAQQRRPAADGLEQAFVSTMLKYAGPRESIGESRGEAVESQFNSLLNDAYAREVSLRIDLKIMADIEKTND